MKGTFTGILSLLCLIGFAQSHDHIYPITHSLSIIRDIECDEKTLVCFDDIDTALIRQECDGLVFEIEDTPSHFCYVACKKGFLLKYNPIDSILQVRCFIPYTLETFPNLREIVIDSMRGRRLYNFELEKIIKIDQFFLIKNNILLSYQEDITFIATIQGANRDFELLISLEKLDPDHSNYCDIVSIVDSRLLMLKTKK